MAKNLEITLLLDFYGDMLTDKQRDVIELYYNEDLSLSEIAETSGITRQGVRDSIKRGEQILIDLEEKLGLCAKFNEFAAALDSIKSLAEEVLDDCDRYSYPKSTAARARDIIRAAEDAKGIL